MRAKNTAGKQINEMESVQQENYKKYREYKSHDGGKVMEWLLNEEDQLSVSGLVKIPGFFNGNLRVLSQCKRTQIGYYLNFKQTWDRRRLVFFLLTIL